MKVKWKLLNPSKCIFCFGPFCDMENTHFKQHNYWDLSLSQWLSMMKFSQAISQVPLQPPGYRLINYLSACGWWRYMKFVLHIFNQVMHFIVAWLCAVQRGKGTGHPTPFNSWLSMPRSGGMRCAVHAGMCVHACIWCQHCMRIQPAFGLKTTHTHTHTHTHTSQVKSLNSTIWPGW
jgi:hypothetical protein